MIQELKDILAGNTYPGRGIIIGLTPDGRKAAIAYFIMGRSRNSQNRIFKAEGGSLRTEAYDPSLVEDPSLIIYRAICPMGNKTIVANGDQSETILAGMTEGKTFENALCERTYEPDAPHYTPRISGLVEAEGAFSYKLSILKKDPAGDDCFRLFWNYTDEEKGIGHFISTYDHDGNPLPTFSSEPKKVTVLDDPDVWAESLWEALDDNNRISLAVRFISLEDGSFEQRIINKHEIGK